MAAFQIPVIYGLGVDNNLSDLPDKGNALRNLGLEPQDLKSLGNISEYIDTEGFQSISNLSEPIQRLLSRYNTDTFVHPLVLETGQNITNITTNVTINGALASSSIRYFSLDYYDSMQNTFLPIDISTSRASVWSDFGNVLSYGGNVKLTKGGSLSLDELKINIPSQLREFESSETATHTIKVKVGGKEYLLYAMRDIPLVFNGFFRSFSFTVRNTDPNTLVSCKIYRSDTGTEVRRYRDLPYVSSVVSVRGFFPSTATRTIEIYCNPNFLDRLVLSNLGLSDLPKSSISSLQLLDISSNFFTSIPNMARFAPNLQNLNISNNLLYNATDLELRSFTEKFIRNLPVVTTLIAGNTMRSNIEIVTDDENTPMSVIEKYLPLTQLSLDRGAGNSRFTGVAPSVSASCITYNIANNSFTQLPTRGLFRPSSQNRITSLTMGGNVSLSLSPVTSAAFLDGENYSNNLLTFNIQDTLLPIPNLQNKSSLREVYFGTLDRVYPSSSPLSAINNEFSLVSNNQYKFSGCSNLQTLRVDRCPIRGELPIFNNNNLNSIFLFNTSLTGSQKPVSPNTNHALYVGTFTQQCRGSLRSFTLVNNNLSGFVLPLEPGAFDNLPALTNIRYNTTNTTGATPNFNNCGQLVTISLDRNAFTELSEISQDCRNTLTTIEYSVNNLQGGTATKIVNSVSGILSLSQLFQGDIPFTRVRTINLRFNQFNGLQDIDKVPNLATLNVSSNNLEDAIPDFSKTPNLITLDLSNNRLTKFTPKAFDNLRFIRTINLANNMLTVSQVELIIDSLHTMYFITSNRNNRGVVIDLATPGGPFVITNTSTIKKVNDLISVGRYTFRGLTLQPPTT
jgi:hypothetical protein